MPPSSLKPGECSSTRPCARGVLAVVITLLMAGHALAADTGRAMDGGGATAYPAPPAALVADQFADQRRAFEAVLKAQSAGAHKKAARLVRGLENYVLYPYFEYYTLRHNFRHRKAQEIDDFLARHKGSYLATRVRGQWLELLARRGRWSAYLKYYEEGDDLAPYCHSLTARLASGDGDAALPDIRDVWLKGHSLPDECDPAFKALYASPLMDDALLGARIELAMAENNPGLARWLTRKVEGDVAREGFELWLTAHRDPAGVLRRSNLPDNAATRRAMVHAVARLARRQVSSAEKAWQRAEQRFGFDDNERATALAGLALGAARSDHDRRLALLDQVPEAGLTADVQRYRLREGIAAQAWEKLARWTDRTPPDTLNALRWQYWRARALMAIGREDEATPILDVLAGERDYYGFLAADLRGREYAFNHQPVAPSAEELEAVGRRPGLLRARELHLLDRRTQSRREWRHELDHSSLREMEIAAYAAAAWGWPDQAIATLGTARSYDDVALRFPLEHESLIARYAAKRDLPAARIYAIMRSESAFARRARSGAGARGLMQLMPATARETAARIGLKLKNLGQLYEAQTNIALGSAYLAQMLRRYGGHFAMAAAAYNAGPHRVRRWQQATCVPADIWIDTIPFTETRRYVRRAYFYVAIYEWRMAQPVSRLTRALPPIPARNQKTSQTCKP